MARKKDIRKRIKSVANTKKITRTMELVATAKSKKSQDRLKASQPYARTLAELVGALVADAGAGGGHPLFGERAQPVKRELVLVVTANRGLCGGYNTNILKEVRELMEERKARGVALDILCQGKKGLAWFDFRKIALAGRITHIEDKPSFNDASAVGDIFIKRFLAGQIDKAWVLHQHYQSAGVQKPRLLQVLPIRPVETTAATHTDFIYEPDAARILGEILPLAVKTSIFNALVESAASEQIARRVAMKLATDNADEMVGRLTKFYNRARQSEITQQIAEIVGGAAALQ